MSPGENPNRHCQRYKPIFDSLCAKLLLLNTEQLYNVKTVIFLIMIKVADEAIRRNYLKEDLGWISENLH